MTRTQQIMLAVLVIALIGVFSYFVVKRMEVTSPTAPLQAQRYVNTTYGYSFEYPAADSIDEYTPQYVAIIDSQLSQDANLVAESDVQLSDPSQNFQSFGDFVHHQAQIGCDADGPTGSLRCPNIASTQTFVSTSGISGEEFYLTEVAADTTGATTSVSQVGPYFAFNISANVSSSTFAALLIYPPVSIPTGQINSALIQSIANSVQINQD